MSSLTRRHFFPCLLSGVFTASLLAFSPQGFGQEATWDRAQNITDAAVAIAVIQKEKGSRGAFEVIKTCYETAIEPAESYTQGVERCLTQDIINSRMTAAFYGSLSAEARERNGVPAPETITDAMGKRVSATFARLEVPPATAREIVTVINGEGETAFRKARFPQQ
ncbi:hypothetical protein [Denitrobaculum tricleocarpae]|uniref:Uncharacterized protein n=1 Tax=Denitrobaculum tricleocarpae TaxID=2591009 RepID=A0A545U2V3_9PROT|nr:hypothetical protein [Denitrobaculum tricleocarpae]TQV83801.1 hypothetical protein FKG95_04265 [Denitrobaculum tricleocarpae]